MKKVRLLVCASALDYYSVLDAQTGKFLGYADLAGRLTFGPNGCGDPIKPPEELDIIEDEEGVLGPPPREGPCLVRKKR